MKVELFIKHIDYELFKAEIKNRVLIFESFDFAHMSNYRPKNCTGRCLFKYKSSKAIKQFHNNKFNSEFYLGNDHNNKMCVFYGNLNSYIRFRLSIMFFSEKYLGNEKVRWVIAMIISITALIISIFFRD
jgi:hypothetical protein